MDMMEKELDQSYCEFAKNNSRSNSVSYQHDFHENDIEACDLDILLEEIEKTEDLDVLDEIHSRLIEENQHKAEELKLIYQQKTELKDEISTSKCFTKELDQVHSTEQQKIKHLREQIKAKHHELLEEQGQQVEHLGQFEDEARNITKKFRTAPKEYASDCLQEKVYQLQQQLEDWKSELEQRKEELSLTRDRFNEPVIKCPTDLSMKVFDESIIDITSLNNNLTQSVENLTKEIEKLRLYL